LNILGFEPLVDALINLVSHATDEFELFCLTALKLGWVIKRPMLVYSHIQEKGRAVLLRIS